MIAKKNLLADSRKLFPTIQNLDEGQLWYDNQMNYRILSIVHNAISAYSSKKSSMVQVRRSAQFCISIRVGVRKLTDLVFTFRLFLPLFKSLVLISQFLAFFTLIKFIIAGGIGVIVRETRIHSVPSFSFNFYESFCRIQIKRKFNMIPEYGIKTICDGQTNECFFLTLWEGILYGPGLFVGTFQSWWQKTYYSVHRWEAFLFVSIHFIHFSLAISCFRAALSSFNVSIALSLDLMVWRAKLMWW